MKDDLLKRAATQGERSVRHFLDDDAERFVVQAATCLEFLGKARLAAFHPALIVDPRDLDALLHVSGAGSHAKKPLWQIHTVGGKELLERCLRVEPRLRDVKAQVEELIDVRNAWVHLGEDPAADISGSPAVSVGHPGAFPRHVTTHQC